MVEREGGSASELEREAAARPRGGRLPPASLAARLAAAVEPLDLLEPDFGPLIERIGDARVVLLGEATHGTSEFYRLRAQITRALIEQKGFDVVAVEADWPDARRIDAYVCHRGPPSRAWRAFARFPTWMWRNVEVRDLVEWMRRHNAALPPDRRAGFYGLDLYALHLSIGEVLEYLKDADPELARVAAYRYGCLGPWESEPAEYGRAVLRDRQSSCAEEVASMLAALLRRRVEEEDDGERLFDARQNARLVANAERYYRIMFYGAAASWNLRDRHMNETLEAVLAHRGPRSRAVVWAHNSHIGDAAATAMAARGETNLGELCRGAQGERAFLVGFGTDRGTVAAAREWDGPMEVMDVRPALEGSHEALCRETGVAGFCLPLRGRDDIRRRLDAPRLQRFIGVVYRPETERASHYFEAAVPRQYDEYVWIAETRAVQPLDALPVGSVPQTWPFGL